MSKEKIEELRQKLNKLFNENASYVKILKVSHELDKCIIEEQKKLEKKRKYQEKLMMNEREKLNE